MNAAVVAASACPPTSQPIYTGTQVVRIANHLAGVMAGKTSLLGSKHTCYNSFMKTEPKKSFPPIGVSGNDSSFDLRLAPDGVYLGDGRFVPSRGNASTSVDNNKSVVTVHNVTDKIVDLCGRIGRVQVE